MNKFHRCAAVTFSVDCFKEIINLESINHHELNLNIKVISLLSLIKISFSQTRDYSMGSL